MVSDCTGTIVENNRGALDIKSTSIAYEKALATRCRLLYELGMRIECLAYEKLHEPKTYDRPTLPATDVGLVENDSVCGRVHE